MSRQRSWLLLIAILIVAGIAAIVYSRQSTRPVNDESMVAPTGTTQPQPQPTQPAETPANPAPKQTCELPLEHSPAVGGVRLGMSVPEVLAKFPGASERPEVKMDLDRAPTQFGERRFIISPDLHTAKPNSTGINQITFTSLDGAISDINASYRASQSKSVDEFASQLSEQLKLPNAWEPQVGMDDKMKIMKCDGFEVRAFSATNSRLPNYVQLRDLKAERKLKDRQQKAIEKAQKEANP